MKLNRYTVIGGFLMSLPIIAVLSGMVLDIGVLGALAVIAGVAVLMVCFWWGWSLIERGLRNGKDA